MTLDRLRQQAWCLAFGVILKKARKRGQRLLVSFAGSLSTSQPTLSRVERGQTPPSALIVRGAEEELELPAGTLRKRADDLLELTEKVLRDSHDLTDDDVRWAEVFARCSKEAVRGLMVFCLEYEDQ